MFLLKNSLFKNYFSKISLVRYKNKYQNSMYCIGLSVDRDTKINTSVQFQFKKKPKCVELNRLLIQKFYKMKSIL